jgi:hypothetical protein
MDPTILGFQPGIREKLRVFPDDAQHWRDKLAEADILMQWRTDFHHHDASLNLLMKSVLRAKKSWRVDRHKERYEGSFYLKLSHDANKGFRSDLENSRQKFDQLARALGTARKGYVFGTGPSLGTAMDLDFSDGVTIACNSMVRNMPLLEHLHPRVVTIADPIFHAGCSRYAGEFRTHLLNVMDTFDAFVVVPFRDYKLYMSNLPPRYGEKIIGIPLEHIDTVNFNLKDSFVVKSTSNVLTLFMLPLAATFFSEIGILGCDGRKLNENGYFWSHHKESQFTEEMEGIRDAHPAFFALDYNDYYLTHCEILESWLVAGEERGITFANLTPSFIPALQKRS